MLSPSRRCSHRTYRQRRCACTQRNPWWSGYFSPTIHQSIIDDVFIRSHGPFRASLSSTKAKKKTLKTSKRSTTSGQRRLVNEKGCSRICLWAHSAYPLWAFLVQYVDVMPRSIYKFKAVMMLISLYDLGAMSILKLPPSIFHIIDSSNLRPCIRMPLFPSVSSCLESARRTPSKWCYPISFWMVYLRY